MAERKVAGVIYTCDSCGVETFHAKDDPEPPLGVGGTVSVISGLGGWGTKFFACSEKHAPDALMKALEKGP